MTSPTPSWRGPSGPSWTSVQAHDEITRSGRKNRQEQQVLDVIKANLGISRRKIAQITGFELGSVSGRVNSLLKAVPKIVFEMGTEIDPKTKKTVKLVWPDTSQDVGPHPELF